MRAVPEIIDFREVKSKAYQLRMDHRLQRLIDALPDQMKRDEGGLDMVRAVFIQAVKGWPV